MGKWTEAKRVKNREAPPPCWSRSSPPRMLLPPVLEDRASATKGTSVCLHPQFMRMFLSYLLLPMDPSSSCAEPRGCLWFCLCLLGQLSTQVACPLLFSSFQIPQDCVHWRLEVRGTPHGKEPVRCSFQLSRLACLGGHARRNRSQVRQPVQAATLTSVIHAHWSPNQRHGCKDICLS